MHACFLSPLLSGERYVTFDGIAKACAKAAGAPEPELIHYNAKDFDFGKVIDKRDLSP